ncbi:hypothetical protein XENOCAPTIV_002587 [Xenoophorus captivus]|uniref:Ig-like domain-containing protein n=1 Tax=Xenoophorus captivus TaxID=1517983 RepID=A0ABV0RNA5_9TELE
MTSESCSFVAFLRTVFLPGSIETPHLAQEMEDRSVAVGDTVALQCKALGSPTPRITWLHNDQPLQPSDRHYFTPGNQLLVIRSASMEDTGRYTCLMSNTLGTERAHSQLVVTQRRSVCVSPAGLSTVTIGIIVIAVVTSIVATSLVWVCIIYQTRKKSEECSVTNTGFDGAVMCTDCMETGNSYGDADYLTHGYGLARGGEYQQQQLAPPRYSQCNLGEQRDPGSHLAAPLCNGTPHGIRKDMQGSTYPENHNTIERSQNNRKASRVGHTLVGCPSQDDSFHEPVKLAGGTNYGRLDTDCEPELRQTLLPNGHGLRASQNENAPLGRSSD